MYHVTRYAWDEIDAILHGRRCNTTKYQSVLSHAIPSGLRIQDYGRRICAPAAAGEILMPSKLELSPSSRLEPAMRRFHDAGFW